MSLRNHLRHMERSKQMNKYFKKGCILLFWLGIWILLALAVNNQILMATPLETLRELLQLLAERDFYVSVGRSLLRIGSGFLAGFFAAVLLAAASRRFPVLEELLSPLMKLIMAVPVASFVVLLLIWWGSSFLAVAICFLVVLPSIYISTLEGLKATDKKLLEMAKVFRLPFSNRFFYLYRPALKPFLYSSLKVSLGMCWKSGVAAEVIGIPDFSIGEQLYMSKIYLNTAGVFAWTAVIILMSLLFEKAVLRLTEAFFVWQPRCKRPEPGAGKFMERKRAGKDCAGKERVGQGDAGKDCAGKERVGQGDAGKKSDRKVSGNILVEGVEKSFGEQRVLAGVNAVYEPGRIYYLRQPSGSGKTTLLFILAGLLKPDRGNVSAPDTVSMMFQEDRLCEAYSAIKNVELVCGDRRRAEEALAGLLEREALEKPCAHLSGGMRRRVALVRAMEADAAFVLLDEPFTGMDAETRARAEDYIRAGQNGRTILIATHI